MRFDPGLQLGEIVSNERLRSTFGCSLASGMARSHRTGTLLLVTAKDSPYHDRRVGDLWYYTGMGRVGDQKMSGQNRNLAESGDSDIDVFLVERISTATYRFLGRVSLAAAPAQETQPDINGDDRFVWVFPIRLEDFGEAISDNEWLARQEEQDAATRRFSDSEVAARAHRAQRIPTTSLVTSIAYNTSTAVRIHARRRAHGTCELCGNPAPFATKNGEPYLETHHITWLSEGGEDSVANTVALCPNCHRKMHALDMQQDRRLLREIADQHQLRD